MSEGKSYIKEGIKHLEKAKESIYKMEVDLPEKTELLKSIKEDLDRILWFINICGLSIEDFMNYNMPANALSNYAPKRLSVWEFKDKFTDKIISLRIALAEMNWEIKELQSQPSEENMDDFMRMLDQLKDLQDKKVIIEFMEGLKNHD